MLGRLRVCEDTVLCSWLYFKANLLTTGGFQIGHTNESCMLHSIYCAFLFSITPSNCLGSIDIIKKCSFDINLNKKTNKTHTQPHRKENKVKLSKNAKTMNKQNKQIGKINISRMLEKPARKDEKLFQQCEYNQA